MFVAPKLLLDEMLKGLVKWLRAAGYNTANDSDGVDDELLLQRAIDEDRLLVTLDRQLAEHDSSGRVRLLDCNDNSQCAAELSRQLGIDWLHRPFSRCLVCNTPLQTATEAQRAQAPADIQADPREMLYCPACERLYWEGGHVARMRQRLESWAHQYNCPAGPE